LNRISITEKRPLRGEVIPLPDKSITHRAVILSSLSEGKSVIRNPLMAEDPLRTLHAFRQMGIAIHGDFTGTTAQDSSSLPGREITIHGKGLYGLRKPVAALDCGNSGTTMRLLSGVLAGQPFHATLTGDRFLKKRPMQRIITPLTRMGAVIRSRPSGLPPLEIQGGTLKPVRYASPIASAQVKSAILLAGLYCEGTTSVSEPARSRDHTERMLRAAGADVETHDLEVKVTGRATLRPLDITVPGDFSSAAFFLVAGTLIPGSEVVIRDTCINQTRTGLIDILRKMKADITIENLREVSGEPVADIVIRHSRLVGVEVGGDLVLRAIDEFPVLCVAASMADGVTKISGAGELRVKESDRIASMTEELGKLGVSIEELEDGVIITGSKRRKAAKTSSHGDHRVAMSMVVAGLASDTEVTVEDTDCINTSFPGFMSLMEALRKS
jgi:3-phosphoshikimate 1-carboxyvinyltransferase